MNKARGLFVFLLLVIPVAISCAGMQTVRIGTEGAYPPFGYLNDAGELEGFEIDLGNELCNRAQLKCQWLTNDWETIIPNLQGNKYDAIMAGMSITEERDELIDFTQPYFPPEPSVFVALAGAGDATAGGRVAVQTATVQADYLDGKVASLLEYPLAEDTVAAVMKGEADSTFASISYLQDIVAESQGKLVFVGTEILLDKGTGIGMRENDVGLREKLDGAIGEMKQDGSLNDLIRKWFGESALTF